MILISHRGNLDGKRKEFENHPNYIQEAKKKGFDVEIDVWFKDKNFYLGHDKPQYKIDQNFLEDKKFWCHAKSPEALYELSKINCHYFWHNTDDYTITNKGYIWIYPNKPLLKNGICVLPETAEYSNLNCSGICSDFILNYK
tara:strand:- start:288 stop:713 length:426 start_codon:yes stop_codon:yes gene_type:complete